MLCNRLRQTFFTEFVSARIKEFKQAVGEEEQGIAKGNDTFNRFVAGVVEEA